MFDKITCYKDANTKDSTTVQKEEEEEMPTRMCETNEKDSRGRV